jgi:hypothetical protein
MSFNYTAVMCGARDRGGPGLGRRVEQNVGWRDFEITGIELFSPAPQANQGQAGYVGRARYAEREDYTITRKKRKRKKGGSSKAICKCALERCLPTYIPTYLPTYLGI